MEFGEGWTQENVETGTYWLEMEEKTEEDQLMVSEEYEAQIPQLLMADRVILGQVSGDWGYLLHPELLLQVTESHLEQMMIRKPLYRMENFGSFPVEPRMSLLEVIEKVLELAVVELTADQENYLPHQHVQDLH